MNTKIKNNVLSAFDALFNGPEPVYKTPWEKWNMSRSEWTKMYNKSCDEAVRFCHEVETGKFFDEEV